MQFRSSQIYIRYETKRLLRIIAKARGKEETIDQVGDELLEKAILAVCPQLRPLMAEWEAVEDRMTKAVTEKMAWHCHCGKPSSPGIVYCPECQP